ncbi:MULTISPECIES: GAP family protein [Nocardiaceae]|uniref:GAP family protein n=1 Tax=Rhodococcoides kroppenstedtii TaxID=293050 RepID=A0ABS7NUA3_9NOCA|nr:MULTISPECIES: GAP family protein [Rhodococcus]AMY20903.1 hypothetical protein A3Q40_03544 [Rhodococcus sp. PBTS 1]MBY6313409.1 GAP family protein [Rhodococcus kroppenstedtii]MBY6321585.1 GAP family protein [Rhodococcus kroppenstedtii]MBY6400283.1 GAP family protein [Rhodococcus kroppenstedtii]
MTATLLAALAGLALVDSTSLGTLVVPLWFLLAPGRPRVGRLAGYLAVLASFYAVVGMALWSLARLGVTVASGWVDHPAVRGAQLVLGLALFAWSFRFDSRRGSNDVARWRERVTTSGAGVVGLALVAGLSELATMLPYLGAIGLLVSAGVSAPTAAVTLVAYCLVMIAPAAAITGTRLAVGQRLDGPLTRIDRVLSARADTVVGWVVGIVGFVLAASAANALFFS